MAATGGTILMTLSLGLEAGCPLKRNGSMLLVVHRHRSFLGDLRHQVAHRRSSPSTSDTQVSRRVCCQGRLSTNNLACLPSDSIMSPAMSGNGVRIGTTRSSIDDRRLRPVTQSIAP